MTIDETLQLATQMHAAGQLGQAETLLKQILNINPTHAFALHLLGILAYQVNKISLGIQFLQKAIESNPHVALFHSNLGEMHRLLHAVEDSILCGERAIALDPYSPTALANLGIAYYDAKQYDHAITCHQRALAINPSMSTSLNNMGSIYRENDNLEKAISFYQAAIAASSQFVDPYNNLGVLFLHQHDYQQAFNYLNQAIGLSPIFADAHCNLGLTLLGLDQYDKALSHFTKALQLKPHYAEAYYGLAKIDLHQHHFIEAENHIHQAIALNPTQVDFYQLLAAIYNEQGNHMRALSYLDHAFSIDATVASVSMSKGNVFMEMGEIAKAEEQFLKLTHHPKPDTRVLAHYSLVQLRKMTSDHPSVTELLSILDHIQAIPASKRDYVYFALGKCFDDIGEWPKAFAYYHKGCELKRQRISYHISEQFQFTQQLIQCFTPQTIDYLKQFAHPSSLPLFIVGMPRSGSTLIEQILSSHSLVRGGGELKYFNELIRWPVETSFHKPLRYPENIQHLSPENYRSIADQYLFNLQRISPHATHITDKMPHNFIAIGMIHALLPQAKIIHVKRNPIDTCLSCYTKLFSQGHYYSYDLTELGQYYRSYELIMNHWRQILPNNAWLDIEYEKMVNDPESESKRLLTFCNLPWDPACLAFYQSKRQVRTASFMQVRQPVYTSSVERWRRFEQELKPLIEILS